MQVRLATASDGATVAEIYAPYVLDTATTFEVDPPSAGEMSRRIAATVPGHPWLVCTTDDGVVGYAYASRHRDRAAYRWAVDTAVYLAAPARGRGFGRWLHAALHDVLTAQGYRQAFAGITLPNPASVALHERSGYRPVGTYRQVGYKLGAWHDVGWWQRPLRPGPEPPSEVRPIDVLDPAELAAALEGDR